MLCFYVIYWLISLTDRKYHTAKCSGGRTQSLLKSYSLILIWYYTQLHLKALG